MNRSFKITALLFLGLIFGLGACHGQTAFKQEIPKYDDGTYDLFYELAKTKAKQLGLPRLEKGFKDLQIRIWYDFSLVGERKLVIISNTDSNWKATVYELIVHWDGNTETIKSKKVRHISPKSGWGTFGQKLIALNIQALPDDRQLPGYRSGNDGKTYNVEVATENQYRFYGYWEPLQFKDKFWQANYMVEILNLIDRELGVSPKSPLTE